MSITKLFAVVALAATTSSAFADAKNVQVWFYSAGPDYYSDGKTLVKDGEWFACCWSSDGVFEGITTDYKPLDPNDKVIGTKALTRNADGWFVDTFQFGSGTVPESGKFCVIILDTREGGTGAVAGATVIDGKTVPNRPSNAAVAVANYTVTMGSTYSTMSTVANAGWGATDPKPTTPAKIVAIDPSGADDVVFVIEDACPGVRYDFKAGSELGKLTTYAAKAPVSGSGRIEVSVPKSEAKFYQLTTAPMTK